MQTLHDFQDIKFYLFSIGTYRKQNLKIIKFCVALIAIITPVIWGLKAQRLEVVSHIAEYKRMTTRDSMQKMLEIKTEIPSIQYDLRYATFNNFTSKRLYKNGASTFARLAVVRALRKVQEELNKKGYGLKIYDAYRPFSVSKQMWDLIQDERYVANPAKGSGHNRGIAVDVTIIDVGSGTELNMGTSFDHFSDTAHHSFQQLPKAVLENRLLLKQTMMKYGFLPLETEWWHYSWPNDRNYTVLDLPFKALARLQ